MFQNIHQDILVLLFLGLHVILHELRYLNLNIQNLDISVYFIKSMISINIF